MTNISGDQGNIAHIFKIFLGTSGFINGKLGIKLREIKREWEHVPPLGKAHSLRAGIATLRVKV